MLTRLNIVCRLASLASSRISAMPTSTSGVAEIKFESKNSVAVVPGSACNFVAWLKSSKMLKKVVIITHWSQSLLPKMRHAVQ
jgi:hypothetical protein